MPHDYLKCAISLNRRKAILKQSYDFLFGRASEFDAIAFRGMSGALIVPSLCDLLEKHLIMVRKPREQENAHTFRTYECDDHARTLRWIIVDDFISSGNTVREIWRLLREQEFPRPTALFMYRRDCSSGVTRFVLSSFSESLVDSFDIPVWRP